MIKSGFVSVVGRPNVGKSTLVNTIVGSKVSIVSFKPQTTRDVIRGIYNDDESQIVFTDTPGIHKSEDSLGDIMNSNAAGAICVMEKGATAATKSFEQTLEFIKERMGE